MSGHSAAFGWSRDAWREIRDEYENHLEAAVERAERATAGCLLNQRGKDNGIDARSLFMGRWSRAKCYASAELIEHWQRHPRITFKDFEAMSLDVRGSALAS
jgi:hypothetical protein